MLFSDITDCEMLVYRCIQEADNEIGLVGIMDELEKKYLYVSQFQKEMDVMRVELINILESNEATNELPDYFNSESSQVFPILKKISEQLRIQAIWHDSVYGYYEYIGTSNALITSTGTKFSKSVKTSTERFLMVYLSANMTRRQNSLYHEFVKIEDTHLLFLN